MEESSAAQLGQLAPRRIAVTAQVQRLDFVIVAFIGCISGCREESEQKEHAAPSLKSFAGSSGCAPVRQLVWKMEGVRLLFSNAKALPVGHRGVLLFIS